jgi:hypothetical protein
MEKFSYPNQTMLSDEVQQLHCPFDSQEGIVLPINSNHKIPIHWHQQCSQYNHITNRYEAIGSTINKSHGVRCTGLWPKQYWEQSKTVYQSPGHPQQQEKQSAKSIATAVTTVCKGGPPLSQKRNQYSQW